LVFLFLGVLVLVATFSFLVLLFLGVLVLAASFSFLVLLFLGVLVLAATFSFFALSQHLSQHRNPSMKLYPYHEPSSYCRWHESHVYHAPDS